MKGSGVPSSSYPFLNIFQLKRWKEYKGLAISFMGMVLPQALLHISTNSKLWGYVLELRTSLCFSYAKFQLPCLQFYRWPWTLVLIVCLGKSQLFICKEIMSKVLMKVYSIRFPMKNNAIKLITLWDFLYFWFSKNEVYDWSP